MIKQGRVIRIFDDEKIAINLGDRDGLTSGTRLAIYAPEVEIEDPETQESLGTYRHLKAVARSLTVEERFTIAGPYPRRERQQSSPSRPYLFPNRGRLKTIPGELPISEDDAHPLPSGNEIRIGDPVEFELEDPAAESGSEAQGVARDGD